MGETKCTKNRQNSQNTQATKESKTQMQENPAFYCYIGTTQTLYVEKKTQHGIYLANEDLHATASVLLPNAYTKGNEKIGDAIEVFLYTDSEDRIIATTQKPLAQLNEIALLQITDKNQHGLFLNIGLQKDIFMPTKMPKNYPIHSFIVVRITHDKQHRLIAKKDITPLLKPCYNPNFLHHRVRILTFAKSELGFSCVILPYYYQGFLYHNTLYSELQLYTHYQAKVSKVRKDGKLDLILERDNTLLMQKIQECNTKGLYFNIDEAVLQQVCMSKKGVKKELSLLITQKQIAFLKGKGYYIPTIL